MRAPDAARLTLAGVIAAGVLSARAPARADGAFPDSQIILTPADPAREIILVTNFGLLRSEDEGATWLWACEQLGNSYAFLYQLGLPPRRRLYAVANQQVVFSDDSACGWSAAGGLLPGAGAGVSDLWVDRTVVDRVLAVNVTCCDGDAGVRTHTLIASTNGGSSFGAPLYQADPGAMITGVESARSAPDTIYLTLLGAPVDGGPPPPMLARTTDGGHSWRAVDLTGQVGAGALRLVAVDPVDPQKVFLLWNGTDNQALVMTGDAGASARKVLVPAGVMKAFLRLDSGTLLVSTDDSGAAGLFRSRDGGETFAAVPSPPHVRALSQRAGTVYAATDNFSEGYAVGASADEGSTWTPLLAYEDVRAIVPCLKAACQSTCDAEAQLSLWPEDVCSADAPAPPATSGTGGSAGGGLGGASAGTGGRASEIRSGCACHVARARPRAGDLAASLALALLASLRRRRRRRRRDRGRSPMADRPRRR